MLNYLNGYVLFPLMERYAKRNISAKFHELRTFERLGNEAQKQQQTKELVSLLQFCATEVPYYRDLFQKLQFSPDKVQKDVKYLQDLPLLTKQIVRDNTEKLKSSTAIHARKTGGSTGQSAFFFFDNEGLDWTAAINLLSYSMAGKKPHHRDLHTSADQDLLGIKPKTLKTKLINGLKLTVMNRNVLMVSSFADEDLGKLFATIKRHRPYLVQAHPSTMSALANYVKSKSLNAKNYFSVLEPTGEMLTDKIVQNVTEAFGCKIVNRYGNAEFGVVAHSKYEDSYNRLMVFRRAFYIEECEDAPLVITNFTNRGFPLIRYDTGDVGTVREENDGCFLYDIKGRVHDIVTIGERNYPTHFIMDVLDHKVGGIREFQIVLENNELPHLKIVPEPQQSQERIQQTIRQIFPTGLKISFIEIEHLETSGWRKKFRHVIDHRTKS